MDKKIDIYCLNNNKKFLQLIKRKFDGIIEKEKNNCYLNLKLNIPREKQNSFNQIFAISCVEYFKFNYLNQNIQLTELKPELRLALIKALTQFDSDLDIQVIESRLQKIDKTIFAESFLKFYVPEFYARLNELCALANNNKAHFVMSETFNELFKFILTNINFNGKEVELKKKGAIISIYNNLGKIIFEANESEELNLILKLVEIMPRKIIISVPKTESKALSFVCKLFEKNIVFKNP